MSFPDPDRPSELTNQKRTTAPTQLADAQFAVFMQELHPHRSLQLRNRSGKTLGTFRLPEPAVGRTARAADPRPQEAACPSVV